jgi:LuxR family transcriptional regulator, quorum-sensing system regulator BjaR1
MSMTTTLTAPTQDALHAIDRVPSLPKLNEVFRSAIEEDRKYYLRDPMLRELYRTADPFSWKEVLSRHQLCDGDRAIVSDAAAWNMREGFVIPLYGIGGQFHAVTMAGPKPRTDTDARAKLLLLSIFAYAKARKLSKRPANPVPTLRPRQREALQWVAVGKTDWEIAQIMRISENTVHKHIENAKRAIGVTTRVQAVVDAIRTGQLQL